MGNVLVQSNGSHNCRPGKGNFGIYEVCGKGPKGSRAICHMVASEPPATRPGTVVRKVTHNRSKQLLSWFNAGVQDWGPGGYEGHPTVGQIHYTFGDASLDHSSDRRVLDALIAHYRGELEQGMPVELEFVGHADPRGSKAFNKRLGQQRAEVVQRYVERGIHRNLGDAVRLRKFRSTSTSRGETMPTGHNAADRRVDIVRTNKSIMHFVAGDPMFITMEYKGPLTSKLLFRVWKSCSVGKIGGVSTLEIEIKNPNTGAGAFYSYVGAGLDFTLGSPISCSGRDKDYTEKELPFGLVDVNDFQGLGGIVPGSMGAGVKVLIFRGPQLHNSKKIIKTDGVEVALLGMEYVQIGAGVTAGRWARMPYSTPKQREAHQKEQERQRLKLSPNYGPKY